MRPIIFSEEMVRAILDGEKTQTRRVIKPQPFIIDSGIWYPDNISGKHYANEEHMQKGLGIDFCPYGKIGDYLWVRENLRRYKRLDFLESKFFNPDFQEVPKEYQKWTTQYIATNTAVPYKEGAKEGWCGIALWQWKNKSISPILMPRWASRITLEIINIKVEKVQDITNEDAMNEGVLRWYYDIQYDENSMYYWSPINGSGAASKFSEMWNSVNVKRGYSWDSNPWVWVIEFNKIKEDKNEN